MRGGVATGAMQPKVDAQPRAGPLMSTAKAERKAPTGAGSSDLGRLNLLNGPLEIENSSFLFVDKRPTVFAEVVQKPLRAVAPFLRIYAADTCRRRGNVCHFILPLGGVWGGATTGQKESAGREYECDGFFHDVIV